MILLKNTRTHEKSDTINTLDKSAFVKYTLHV